MSDAAERLSALSPAQRRLAELLLRKRGVDPGSLPIPRRPDCTAAPLSTTQERLWISGLQAEGTAYGNVPMAFRIAGALDPDALARALTLLVERHEILRTTFQEAGGRVMQRIHLPVPVTLPVEDLRDVAAPQREERFAARVAAQAARPFDPRAEMLLRACLFRLEDEEWGLVLVSHHLATDGWGARLLLDELSAAYGVYVGGAAPGLAELPLQYGDYAAWESARAGAGAFDGEVAHWIERLAGAPRQVRLPWDRRESRTVATGLVPFAVPTDTVHALRALSRTRGTTLYVTLLAAFQCLLHRYGGQDDVVVGTILSRRTRTETEPLVGNFGSNLLLRTSFGGGPSLQEVLGRTAATVRDALAHSGAPLERVARAAPVPAFHVMFVLRDGGLAERLRLPGTAVRAVPAHPGAATLDLILDVTDGEGGVEGYFEYRRDRFDAATMERMAARYVEVLARLVVDASAPVDSLPVWKQETPGEAVAGSRADGGAPRTEPERLVAALWAEALEIDRVSRHDNFFDLGGDSMRATWVLERVERATGRRLTPLDFGTQTLAQVAALLEAEQTVETESPPPSLARRFAGALFGRRP